MGISAMDLQDMNVNCQSKISHPVKKNKHNIFSNFGRNLEKDKWPENIHKAIHSALEEYLPISLEPILIVQKFPLAMVCREIPYNARIFYVFSICDKLHIGTIRGWICYYNNPAYLY